MAENQAFIRVLNGENLAVPPVWLMRQAGRYLPEYMEVRKKAGSFLTLCYTPELATEVTLQPIRRFGFDAAILFSDILVVPDAMGQSVSFEAGEGPRLEPIRNSSELTRLDADRTNEKFSIVWEAVARIRSGLPSEVSLIGFCGAPWTVATYMVGGKGSADQAETRKFAYSDQKGFAQLIDILVNVSVEYLCGQIKAGAQALQIFDSWAGNLPDNEFRRWVIEPNAKIVKEVRKQYPDFPIIGFPRNAGPLYDEYVEKTGVNCVGCDTSLSLDYMRGSLQKKVAVQGNLDPILLLNGGVALDERIREIVSSLSDGPHVFNLGHGILPQTPPENVARLMEVIRQG
jgi:uroporphyrinogen decarboxylase